LESQDAIDAIGSLLEIPAAENGVHTSIQSMSDSIRKRLEDKRKRQIKSFAEERKIDVLCHFTRVENLSGILRDGLLSRTALERSGASFVPTDMSRLDGYLDAVCLSISFPNYKMFYNKRELFWNCSQVRHSQWVVLLFGVELLWELECGFCLQNAAAYSERRVSREEMRATSAFERMFSDSDGVSRQKLWDLNIPRNYPTNPQAEVLVFETVPTAYLREVYFHGIRALETWQRNHSTAVQVKMDHGGYYFKARQDYKLWQQDSAE